MTIVKFNINAKLVVELFIFNFGGVFSMQYKTGFAE